MSVTLERLARNQTLFREVNERLLKLSDGFADGSVAFVCECSRVDCVSTVTMKHDDYESVRAHSTYFVVANDHELLEVERIVERRNGFTIVEKITETEYAVATNPRGHD